MLAHTYNPVLCDGVESGESLEALGPLGPVWMAKVTGPGETLSKTKGRDAGGLTLEVVLWSPWTNCALCISPPPKPQKTLNCDRSLISIRPNRGAQNLLLIQKPRNYDSGRHSQTFCKKKKELNLGNISQNDSPWRLHKETTVSREHHFIFSKLLMELVFFTTTLVHLG